MSEKYQDLKYTKFPNEIDTLRIFKDVDITTKPYVDQFYRYYNAGQFNEANQVILDHPELKDCLINAEMLQTLHDANIALQRTFSSSIIDLFASVIKYQNTFSSTKKYNLYDMFYYQGIPYLVIKQNTPTGTYPPNTTYYAQLAIVGASGTGLSFKENWTSSTIYSQYDCVPYNNQLWVSLVANNVGHTPTSGSTYWKSIITVPKQVIVSSTQPTGQTTGDIWFEYSSGTLKIHEKTSSGYRDLLPAMTADNIDYESGTTLKQVLSNHFAASNPHAITCTKIGAATSSHLHDDRYYTKNQIDSTVTSAAAKKLSTARTINNVSFDGTKNISINQVTSPLAIDVAGLRNIVIREEEDTSYFGEGVVELILK